MLANELTVEELCSEDLKTKDKEHYEDRLEEALRRGTHFLKEDLELDEEGKEIEGELARAFFSLPRETREPLQEKIPLAILKRLRTHRLE